MVTDDELVKIDKIVVLCLVVLHKGGADQISSGLGPQERRPPSRTKKSVQTGDYPLGLGKEKKWHETEQIVEAEDRDPVRNRLLPLKEYRVARRFG